MEKRIQILHNNATDLLGNCTNLCTSPSQLVLFGLVPDFSAIASVLSTALALVIVFEATRAYMYTRKDYLLSFAAGFALLALSYAFLLPLAFGIRLSAIGYENGDILSYPPRLVIHSIGFILIALGYSQTNRAKYFLYTLSTLLIILVVVVILPQMPPVPYSVNALLYLLDTALVAYVIYHMLLKVKPTDLVLIGFLFMALSQYTGVIDTLQSGGLTSFLTQFNRLISLSVLFVAFLRVRIRPEMKEKQPV